MQRWRARITYFTPAKGLRRWEGDVEADTAQEADEEAVRAFRVTRPGLQVPKIVDIRLRRVRG
jgi:hypothetical protein